ncbi:MAG TPA: peptidylprolyl isomerase [Gemmatimonadaceae bacterium]
MRMLPVLLAVPAILAAQAPLTNADSALVGRILLAEDRRDSNDAALRQGESHGDVRIRALVARARGRIRDPRFGWDTARATRPSSDLVPAPPPPKLWPEPAWRVRYRALTARSDCAALDAAVTDSAWPVRLRAADVARGTCESDDALVRTFIGWVDGIPANTSSRAKGTVSWHAAAHGILGLAHVRPAEARSRVARLASHPQWEVRMYAARAAGALKDTVLLRRLAHDSDDNVMEAAIDSLSKLTGHADDHTYLEALNGNGAQATRAAALALVGSPRVDVKVAAEVMFDRWALRANASERDVRIALLQASGHPISSDRPPPPRVELPPMAVALALGADVRLRVTMNDASGGGSFVVKLRGDVAPMMSARVLALVNSGYYNNGNWHRVEHDFVIQGGGPGTNEYVGYKDYLRDELGSVPHARGTVGMSTRAHDTGDAQWFINLKDNPRLGRDYSVFAEVVDGMDVVDGILEGDVIARVEVVR